MREILQQHKFDGGILEKPDEKGEVLTKINSDYYDKSSPHFGDNERFTWAVNKVYESYNSAQTVYELVTMTEFVKSSENFRLKDFTSEEWYNFGSDVRIFSDFITQPLTKEMFIGDGRIFEGNCVYSEDDRYIYMHWLTNVKTAIKLHETKTIEQALNNGVKLYWNGKTI